MKYFTFLLLAFFLFLNVAGVSQDINKTGGFARVSAMGANPYVVDPYFNSINPAWNAVYSNFILADLGSAVNAPFSGGGAGQYLSGSFKLTEGWTLGGILTRNDFNAFSIGLVDPGTRLGIGGVVSTVNNLLGSGRVVPLDNNVEIIGTYTMGSTSFGLGVAYASTTNDYTNTADTISTSGTASQIGFNAGMISDLTRSIKLDVGFSLILPNASYEPQEGSETKASQTIMLVNARVFWNLNKNLQFVPVAAFATSSGTLDSGGVSGSADMLSITQFSFGAGLNYQVGDFVLAGGAIFNNSSVTQAAINGVSPELSASATIFPIWNIGAEWNMTDWFVARLGYVAFSSNITIENPTSETTVDERVISFFAPSQRGITVGVGFRLGDFSLDATVNEDVLRQGFNNIGGGGRTFSYLTASYALP